MIESLTSSADTSQAASATNAFGDLKSDEFVQVLITELSNQDPFKPNDSAALLEQLSSLRNIESQSALQETLESLVLQNSIVQSGSLIGKTVTGMDMDNDTHEGIVQSVEMRSGEAWMRLDNGAVIPFDRITAIQG